MDNNNINSTNNKMNEKVKVNNIIISSTKNKMNEKERVIK